jgi:hypothetical protein
MHEAAEAGDSYQVETLDGKYCLWMPGCVGVESTLAGARHNWKHRLGDKVRLMRVLPGSGVGCMYVEYAGEAVL